MYYYRLRQTDIDDRPTVSETRLAKIKSSGIDLSISPNPAKDFVKIFMAVTSGLSGINLYNVQGQRVKNWPLMNLSSPTNLNISGLSKGIYIFKIKTGNQTMVEKLVIN
ncbi:MAG: T9SS type A sorting domain-containing protein [Ferruginibacter sp.]